MLHRLRFWLRRLLGKPTVAGLFATPNTWYQHYWAVDGDGIASDPNDPFATQWCLYGAIRKIYPPLYALRLHNRVFDFLHAQGYSGGVSNWNDEPGRTQDQVFRLALRVGI